jgi:hypothetical protein
VYGYLQKAEGVVYDQMITELLAKKHVNDSSKAEAGLQNRIQKIRAVS